MMNTLKYQADSKRDLRLDMLRGLSLFVMAINHAGLSSYWQYLTGNSEFLINAAEMFFFISGFTVGMIYRGKEIRASANKLLQRTWEIYRYVLLMAFGFATLTLSTGWVFWESLRFTTRGDIVHWSVGIFSMHVSYHGSFILIVYVVYLFLAPLALYGLHLGKTKLVLTVALFIYLLSQLSLNMTSLPFASFRHLAANNLLFFAAMIIGYHQALGQWWQTKTWSKFIDWLAVLLSIALLVLYVNGFSWWPELGKHVGNLDIREQKMPYLNLIVVFVYIRFFWLFFTYMWTPLFRTLGWLLLPMGQASLFTFVMHFVAIPILWNTPGVHNNLGLFTATLWNLYFIALIYVAVRLRKWLKTKTYPKNLFFKLIQYRLNFLVIAFLVSFLLLAFPDAIASWRPISIF